MSAPASSPAALKKSQEDGQAPREAGTEETASPSSEPGVPSQARWVAPRSRPPVTRWEGAAIVFLTILVHGGIALGAYRDRHAPRTMKRWTKVEVDMNRPPPPPKPVPPPPPEPPKPQKAAPPPKPVAAVAKPEPEKPPPPEEPPPTDTGSSLPSDVDGELYRGSGGLGTAAPAPPPPPKPVAAPPPPPPVIAAKEGANYRFNPRPPYPSRAQREGWEGNVLLRVQVSPSGKPGTIQVQKSSGHQLLDDAAIEAVKRWTFTPATQGGVPISGWVTVPLSFRLQ